MATNRQAFVEALQIALAENESKKFALLKQVWEIEATIEKIREKLKQYGK